MSNYRDNDAQSWYAPLKRETESAKKPRKRKRLSTPWKIGLGALLVLALIAGSSLLFSNGEQPRPEHHMPAQALPYDDGEEELPEDFKEFFSSYFVPEESDGEIRLPKAENVPDFTLEFSEPGRELTLQELYRECADSIVAITGYANGLYGYYWGSGIILSEDGLILTNTHLLEGCDRVTVTLTDDREFEGLLVGADAASDIAVLKIEAQGLKPARFADSATLQVGDHVAAIGNPIGEEFRLSLTDGIVSAIDRGVGQYGRNSSAIQNTAAINEGSSGGALFNMYGQVVGVTNMKMSAPAFDVTIEGMSLAVPSALTRTVVDALIHDGEVRGRTALGITVGAIPEDAAAHYELPDGLYVSAVSKNSDAEAQGVKPGDIITAMNGEPLWSTDQIYEAKNALKVGDTINFTFWRNGKSFDLDIALVDFNDVY